MPADPPSPRAVRVVHRDRHLLVLAKPSGIATTAPRGLDSFTRWAEREVDATLHPTSRLDAEVSGLVTFAFTKRAIAALRRARRQGRYGRGYVALAERAPAPPEGAWEASIGIDPRDPRGRVALGDGSEPRPGGPSTAAGPEARRAAVLEPGSRAARVQAARTTYRLRASVERASLLWLTPHTGRTHQLRVHAAAAGAPLLGDVRYGGPRRLVLSDGRVVAARRVMLHCAWLSLPRVDEPGALQLALPPPDDLRGLWEALGGDPAQLGQAAMRP